MSNHQAPASKRPLDRIKIMVNGETRDLFMSFGLLNELCALIPDAHAATQIALNADLRDVALITVLSPRDEHGVIPEDRVFNVKTMDIPLDDADKLLDWVSEHILYFFLSALKRVVAAQQANTALKELVETAKIQLDPSTTSSNGTAA